MEEHGRQRHSRQDTDDDDDDDLVTEVGVQPSIIKLFAEKCFNIVSTIIFLFAKAYFSIF